MSNNSLRRGDKVSPEGSGGRASTSSDGCERNNRGRTADAWWQHVRRLGRAQLETLAFEERSKRKRAQGKIKQLIAINSELEAYVDQADEKLSQATNREIKLKAELELEKRQHHGAAENVRRFHVQHRDQQDKQITKLKEQVRNLRDYHKQANAGYLMSETSLLDSREELSSQAARVTQAAQDTTTTSISSNETLSAKAAAAALLAKSTINATPMKDRCSSLAKAKKFVHQPSIESAKVPAVPGGLFGYDASFWKLGPPSDQKDGKEKRQQANVIGFKKGNPAMCEGFSSSSEEENEEEDNKDRQPGVSNKAGQKRICKGKQNWWDVKRLKKRPRRLTMSELSKVSNEAVSANKQVRVRQTESSEPGEPSYAYQEVVRGKAARAALPAETCKDCDDFYKAIYGNGPEGDRARAESLYKCGRHRRKHALPQTPPHFWSVPTLTSTQESHESVKSVEL